LSSWKFTGLAWLGAPPPPPLAPPPPLEIAAVAVNEPLPLFALNAGDVATPPAFVVAVACAPLPANVALAVDVVPHMV
jgi:hypothetical protein